MKQVVVVRDETYKTRRIELSEFSTNPVQVSVETVYDYSDMPLAGKVSLDHLKILVKHYLALGQKIEAIKLVRAYHDSNPTVSGFGLKEAKEFVENI